MPTINDVLDAFDELGGDVNQQKALQAALESKGWTASEATEAISAAIDEGALTWTEMRGLKKSTM